MKSFALKTSLLCLMAALFVGCQQKNPDEPGNGGTSEFGVELQTVEADYLEIKVSAPKELEMAYLLSTEPQVLTGSILFVTGTSVKVTPGQVVRITEGVVQDTEYYLYAVAKLDAMTYSDIVRVEFATKKYEFTELLTVVDHYYDGFKMHVTVPEKVKESGNAIRYSGCSLAWYNVLKNASGMTSTDLNGVVATGNPYGNYIKNDSTIIYNDMNVIQLDENGDPVKDDLGQEIDIHDPIVPGEPYIFLAGECKWGSPDEFEQVVGYHMPDNWSYSIPLFRWEFDENGETTGGTWYGEFQKKTFFTKMPAECDATVKIDVPEEGLTVTDAQINFTIEEGVSKYFYMVLDNATYNQILNIYLDGHEEWYQWFLTSYLAFYEWRLEAQSTNIRTNAVNSFNEPLVGGDTYHILCTVFGDEMGRTQRYEHKTFKTREKVKPIPVIEVTPVGNNPHEAVFNVKAPNKDVVDVFWACNYAREFELYFNSGYTYEQLLKNNYTLDYKEIQAINSDEGLNMNFPTIDGETTRLAVYACNDEYSFNRIDPKKEGVGWADYDAPLAPKTGKIDSPLFDALEGDWTATARLSVNDEDESGNIVSREMTYKSKINISASAPALPAKPDEFVYDVYKDTDRDEVDDMFEELTLLTDQFTDYRLDGQNRLLGSGFFDYDFHTPSRTAFMSPYALFYNPNYSSYDVAQIMYDFGPKWFMEIQNDGSVIIPFNSSTMPVMQAWPGYPFYVSAVANGTAFFDVTAEYPGFPVEISDDYNTITIKPISIPEGLEDLEAGDYYMNSLGVNNGQYELIATVISDIVLTRGWTEPTSKLSPFIAKPVEVGAASIDGKPVGDLSKIRIYKSMTKFDMPLDRPVVEYAEDESPNRVTMEMVQKTTDKILKAYNLK